MKATTRLRQMLARDGIYLAPGAFDGMTARLIEQAGFDLVYASGGAIARSCGFPDIGLLSLSEVQQRLAQMTEVTSLPIIADADTGFGNATNARRTLHSFEHIGVAALHIEDQTFPKRCGHLDDKGLISTAEMVHKIHVVMDARVDPDFVVIARTDAIATEGFDAAIERSQAYLEAGADVIFVEAPETLEQVERIAELISQPKLINMFYSGKTPLLKRLHSFEHIGVAALHIEDQTFPKRCGHLDDKGLISTAEMVHKIHVVMDARVDPDFVVIARTDAIATEGFDAAIERSQAYLEAGADVIFVEAPETLEQVERIAELIPQPKLINMFYSGKTPLVEKERLRELGYKIVIIPSDLQRVAIKACQRVLETIRREGDSSSMRNDMVTFKDREEIVQTTEYLSL